MTFEISDALLVLLGVFHARGPKGSPWDSALSVFDVWYDFPYVSNPSCSLCARTPPFSLSLSLSLSRARALSRARYLSLARALSLKMNFMHGLGSHCAWRVQVHVY